MDQQCKNVVSNVQSGPKPPPHDPSSRSVSTGLWDDASRREAENVVCFDGPSRRAD